MHRFLLQTINKKEPARRSSAPATEETSVFMIRRRVKIYFFKNIMYSPNDYQGKNILLLRYMHSVKYVAKLYFRRYM